MSNPSITRLVVGAPRTLVLGVPVGQKVNARDAGTNWSAGRWLLHQGRRLAAPLAPKKRSFSIALRVPKVRNRKMLALGTVAGVVLVASVAGAFLHMRKLEPVAPSPFGAAKSTSLTVLEQPYVAPVQAAAVPEQQQEPVFGQPPPTPLPLPVARLAGQMPAVVQQRAAQADRQTPASESGKVVKPAAVVLDEEAAQAMLAKQIPAALPRVQNSPLPITTKSSPERPVTPASPAPSPRGAGLVAITPDGKVAVFTNPNTRMPEQFKVGDKLPSGDTVKAIDAQSGKVVTTSKEYGLE